jgi:hypothetical protein
VRVVVRTRGGANVRPDIERRRFEKTVRSTPKKPRRASRSSARVSAASAVARPSPPSASPATGVNAEFCEGIRRRDEAEKDARAKSVVSKPRPSPKPRSNASVVPSPAPASLFRASFFVASVADGGGA